MASYSMNQNSWWRNCLVKVWTWWTRSNKGTTRHYSVPTKHEMVSIRNLDLVTDFEKFYLGTNGQFCSKYRGLISHLNENCEFCGSKNVYVDGEVSSVYGYSCLVLPKASLIIGNRSFRSHDAKPNHTYLDSKARYGILPSEVNPQLFHDPTGIQYYHNSLL